MTSDERVAGRSRQLRLAAIGMLAAITLAVVMLGRTSPGDAALVTSAADDAVVAMLGLPGDVEQSRLRAARRVLRQSPSDAGVAATVARQALQLYGRRGDDRMLTLARVALSPWREAAAPPPDVRLLRARIAQTEHRFAVAALDLEAFLTHEPRHLEAQWLAADAWRRAGDIDRARSSCLRLVLSGHLSLAQTCTADIMLSLDRPQQAARLASAAIEALPAQQAVQRQWAYAVHADSMLALGAPQAAVDSLRQASAAAPPTLALRLALADALLDIGQPDQAGATLANDAPSDAVLLRRALADRAIGGEAQRGGVATTLRARYARKAATQVPIADQRSRSLFALLVDGDAKAACTHALANWRQQKGAEDARLLERAARAAGNHAALLELDTWRARWNPATGTVL